MLRLIVVSLVLGAIPPVGQKRTCGSGPVIALR